uniref:Uncharacterized protein n=1 Tax=Cacopsylla melanoneura TaxID=428564 RepID=A0A8D8SBG5_9HEMI
MAAHKILGYIRIHFGFQLTLLGGHRSLVHDFSRVGKRRPGIAEQSAELADKVDCFCAEGYIGSCDTYERKLGRSSFFTGLDNLRNLFTINVVLHHFRILLNEHFLHLGRMLPIHQHGAAVGSARISKQLA